VDGTVLAYLTWMSERKRATYVCLALIGLVVALYGHLWQCDFIDFDDNTHVFENTHVAAGLSWSGIVWAFTEIHGGQWIPLTWISHMADVTLFGMEPGPQHLVAIAIHALSAVLLLATMRALGIGFWESASIAALFAVHPLNVESVAWIAERKNVLSTLFWILATLAYAKYAKRPHAGKMALVFVAMALGLMTKGMLVTLPFALLLLDWWPLKRAQSIGWLRLVIEKLPLFALSAVFSVVTARAAAHHGALHSESAAPLLDRLAYVPSNYLRYLGKLVWPADLSILYPNPVETPITLAVIGALVLGAITVLTLLSRKQAPWALIGWLWFLGTLFPVSGIVPLGKTIFAERFTYIPQIGLFMAAVCSVAVVIRCQTKLLRPIVAAGAAVLVCLSASTFRYVSHWDNTATVFAHATKSTPGNFFAHGTLGWALARQGDLEGAARHYIAALRINPAHAEARANLGVVLSRAGNTHAAVEQFRRALDFDASDYSARFNLATHLILLGGSAEAIPLLEGLLREPRPEPRLHYWLGRALGDAGRRSEAEVHLRIAAAALPQDESIKDALRDVERDPGSTASAAIVD
jgi:tetratricopeptide (TPR) repeat protein